MSEYLNKEGLARFKEKLLAEVASKFGSSINLLDVYPVGSIYMSTASTSPAVLFGGTWEALDQGRVLIGANATYPAGSSGGSESVTLTSSQIPQHSHTASAESAGGHTHSRGSMDIKGKTQMGVLDSYRALEGAFYSGASEYGVRPNANGNYPSVSFQASKNWSGSTSSSGDHSHTVTIGNAGGGGSHSNMQPYLSVYMWKRTA